MLKGSLIYSNGDAKYKYSLECSDNMLTFAGRITSNNYEALQFLETGASSRIYNGEGVLCDTVYLTTRRFDISTSTCKVETLILEDVENGIKPFKWSPNMEFFAQFASLLRYVKSNCRHQNQEGYTGLATASDEFYAETSVRYKVPLADDTYARVLLHLGYIKEIQFNWNGFELNLVDEHVDYPIPFEKIDTYVSCGLSFNSEHIGFDGVHKFTPEIDEYTKSLMYESLQEIIDANPDKDFSWLLEKKYEIVTDETLESVCNMLLNHDGYIFYDTETTGLDFTFKCETGEGDKLVGLILSCKYGESYYFPVRMKRIPNLCNGDDVYFMEHYMRPILEGKDLVVHNLIFDWKVGYVYGINANIVHDTLLLFKVTIGSERPDMSVKLKELTRTFLKRDSLELSDLVKNDDWGESEVTFDELPYELVRLYACPDTDNLYGLLDFATRNNLLQRYNATRVYKIELNFSYAVAYQEYYGHLVDLSRLEDLKKEVTEGISDCMSRMKEIVGHDFNPNSSPQLLKIMYDELAIPPQYDRKTGRKTTSKDALKFLAELTDVEGNTKYPFVKILQEFRIYEAVRKVIDSFPEIITKDGYLFSEVDQFKSTGRVSIKNPNYQSYNDTMKKYIVPRTGYYMTDQDYSSVESRILVSMVGNKETVDAFEDPDFDYHRSRASRMFAVPYEAVTSSLRKQSKGVNFGLFYGMGDPSLGCHIFGEETPENTKKAAVLRSKYFVGLEDVEEAMNRWRNDSVTNGFTSTFFGRRRYYDSAKFSKSKIKRQGGNQVIQGTAADIYKLAVGNLFKRICKEGWLGKVLLTAFVHDELLSEVSCDINPADWLRVSQEEFQVKIDGWCPIYMGFGYGTNWYQAKKVEIPIQLQEQIISDMSSTGLVWNGSVKEFCDQIPSCIDRFTESMVDSYLLDTSNYGGYMKTSIYSSMTDILSDNLGKGNVPKELDEMISKYCEIRGISVPEGSFIEAKIENSGSVDASGIVDIDYDMDYNDNEMSIAEKQRVLDLRVETLGLYLDIEDKIVYLKLVPKAFLDIIQSKCNKTGNGYRIFFVDSQNKKKFTTESYLTSKDIEEVQSLYITYFNSINR